MKITISCILNETLRWNPSHKQKSCIIYANNNDILTDSVFQTFYLSNVTCRYLDINMAYLAVLSLTN
jgi:hypothetical protein